MFPRANTTWADPSLVPLRQYTHMLFLFPITAAIYSDSFWLSVYRFVYCRALNNGYFLVVNAQLGLGGPVCSIVFYNYPKFTQQFQAYYMGHSM